MRYLSAVLLLAAAAAAQGQTISFFYSGPSTGLTATGATSKFGVRAPGASGSHLASVPLAAGMNEPQLAPSLITTAAANQIGLQLAQYSPTDGQFTIATVEGAVPSRGCIVGSDDTGIVNFVGEIAGGGTTRFFGASFAKANAAAPTSGHVTIEVVGRSTTDGHLFGVTSQLHVAAGETPGALNLRIRNDLIAKGCSVFDITMPSFAAPNAFLHGLGVDRFVGLAGIQLGHEFRVSKVLLVRTYGAAIAIPLAIGLGWFPTGGFAEYGSGFAAAGKEPSVRGSGQYAPGSSYDVTLDFHHHEAGVLVGATGRGALALPGGATLLLDPATVVSTTPFVTNGQGRCTTNHAIPNNPAVLGQTVHWQGFAPHAGALAATSGLYVRVWQ
jgi:hypothetical protein